MHEVRRGNIVHRLVSRVPVGDLAPPPGLRSCDGEEDRGASWPGLTSPSNHVVVLRSVCRARPAARIDPPPRLGSDRKAPTDSCRRQQ